MSASPDAPSSILVSVTVLGPQPLDDQPQCPLCDEPLHRYQPDIERTEAMLGSCPECGDWFILVCDPDQDRMWVTHLPLNQLGLRPTSASAPVGGLVAPQRKLSKRSSRNQRRELRAG